MKKFIIIILSVLIPIIAALGIVVYGIKIRYVPDQNQEVVSEFNRYLNKGVITSEGRIANYRKMENYYYEEEPILNKDITNEEGKRLFSLKICRNLCVYQPSANVDATLKTLFEVFIYNVDYTEVKKYFVLDDMTVIEKADMPTFTVTFTSTTDSDAKFDLTLSNRSNVMIPDYNSIPEYADEENKTRNYVQSAIFREYEDSVKSALQKIDDEVNVTVNSTLVIKNDDSSTTVLNAKSELANELVKDFKHKGSKIDKNELTVGYRAASVNDTYRNAGFNKWIVKRYLWWEALVAFAVTGLITGTFAVVYIFDEGNNKQAGKKGKRK